MDTSPEYINMCRRAKELQEMWKPQIGDWIYQNSALPDKITVVYKYSLEKEDMKIWDWVREDWYTMQECVWLPRIDQWLQILSDKNIIFGLSNYAQGDSVEITCIKLLCLNIYNKYWNGEDWI